MLLLINRRHSPYRIYLRRRVDIGNALQRSLLMSFLTHRLCEFVRLLSRTSLILMHVRESPYETLSFKLNWKVIAEQHVLSGRYPVLLYLTNKRE